MQIKIGDRFRDAKEMRQVWVVRRMDKGRCELQCVRRWNLRIVETPDRLANSQCYSREAVPMALNSDSSLFATTNRVILKPELSEVTRSTVLDEIHHDAFGSVEIEPGEEATAIRFLEFTDFEMFSARFGWAFSDTRSEMAEGLS